MRIGELAKQAGINASRIRFYESAGILPRAPRLANGYREYDDRALRIVQFVDLAQGLGFTLREIGDHLRSPEDDGRKARLQRRLESKLAELDSRIAEIRRRRATLLKVIGEVRATRAHKTGSKARMR